MHKNIACFVLISAALLASSLLQAGQVDYLLRRIANEKGVPPGAVDLPNPLAKHGSTYKPGLGELLLLMYQRDAVFARAYDRFLDHLDDVNTRMAAAGGGAFRQPSVMRGAEDFARAIVAMGGSPGIDVRANDLGLTSDGMFDVARELARASLAEENLDLSAEETDALADLLALGQIAAAANRVMPPAYVAKWREKHPDLPEISETPPEGFSKMVWEMVRIGVPWMYHSGAFPWLDPTSKAAHDFYDTYHFYSHAWLVRYNLYRSCFFRMRFVFFKPTFEERNLGNMMIRKQLAHADTMGLGYEFMTTALKSGFADITPADDLPPGLQKVAKTLRLGGLPFVEAFRDMDTNHAGAIFGAALAVGGPPIAPSDRAGARARVDRYLAGESPLAE